MNDQYFAIIQSHDSRQAFSFKIKLLLGKKTVIYRGTGKLLGKPNKLRGNDLRQQKYSQPLHATETGDTLRQLWSTRIERLHFTFFFLRYIPTYLPTLRSMFVFISLFRAVCTLVLLVHKKRTVIAPNQNTGLYQESAPRPLMVRKCFLQIYNVPTSRDGEQGWRSGEGTRLPLLWTKFDSGPLSYVGRVCRWFSPCFEGFSPDFPVFLPPQNPTSPDSNSTMIEDPHIQLRVM